MDIDTEEIKTFCKKEFDNENDPIGKEIIFDMNEEKNESYDITSAYDIFIVTNRYNSEKNIFTTLENTILYFNKYLEERDYYPDDYKEENIEKRLSLFFKEIYSSGETYRGSHLTRIVKVRGGSVYTDYFPEIQNIDYLFLFFIKIFNSLYSNVDKTTNIGRYYKTFFKIYFSIKAKLTKEIPKNTKTYTIRKCLRNRFQQQSGTCWVSSVLNELILSENIRNIIINKLYTYTFDNINSIYDLLNVVNNQMIQMIGLESRKNTIQKTKSTIEIYF